MYEKNLELTCRIEIQESKNTFKRLKENDIKMLSATLDALLIHEPFAVAFQEQNRDKLYEFAGPLFDELKIKYGITHFYFIYPPPSNKCFLRVHKRDFYNDVITRITFAKSVKSASFGTGIELGKTAFALRVVHPFYYNKQLIGYLELGQEIDYFLEAMKSQSGNEYGLLVLKNKIDENKWASVREKKNLHNNWNDMKTSVLIAATTKNESLIDCDGDILNVPDNGLVLQTIRKDDKTFVRGIFPIYDAGNNKIGAIFVLRNITELYNIMRNAQMKIGLFVIIFAILVAIIMLALMHKFIFKRLESITIKITKLVGGDYTTPINQQINDEVGRFESLLEQFRQIFINMLDRKTK